MATHASHAALPYPIKGARFSFLVPSLDETGTPTDVASADSSFSVDAGDFAACAEEVTVIAGTADGLSLMTLTGAETNGSAVGYQLEGTGPKATTMTFHPRVLPSISTGTLSAGSASGGTLNPILDYDIRGCFIKTTGGTGGGGTGGANNQARKIITYNTSTGVFTVEPDFETAVSTDTTYSILLPDGVIVGNLTLLIDSDDLETAVVNGNTTYTTPTLAQTQSAAADALVAINLDHLFNAVDTDWATTVGADSALGLMASKNSSNTFDRTTDSLEGQADTQPAALLDLTDGVESGVTVRQALRGMSSILVGIISGAGTGNEVFKGIAQASGGTTRVTVTADNDGNRSAVTLNL